MVFNRLEEGYFFEISLLCEAYFAQAVLEDIPMVPIYSHETSSLHSPGDNQRLCPEADLAVDVPRFHELFHAGF